MRKYVQYISYCFAVSLISLSLAVCACAPKPKLTSITIVSATPAIFQLGTTQQFTATGTYADNSTKDTNIPARCGLKVPHRHRA